MTTEEKEKLKKMLQINKITHADEDKIRRVSGYVEAMELNDIKLSGNDLIELILRFANECDDEFFEFLVSNYEELCARKKKPGYVAPAATIVSTEQAEICVAAVLGIGIGWGWVWLAVSPWTTLSPVDKIKT